MRWTAATAVVALGATIAGPMPLAGQQRSSGAAHEITHVVQQQGTDAAVLTLDGARLVLAPGSVDGATVTLRIAPRATMPCSHRGFEQIGDTLVIDGSLRGARGGVRVSIVGRPGPERAGQRLVLVAEREPAASVGGSQTETVGASQTLTVGGSRTAASDGRYYVTSARHDARSGRIEAELGVDGRFRSVHFGWLPSR